MDSRAPRSSAPSRRGFLAATGAFATVPFLQSEEPRALPRRALGRTGREVPVLGLGCYPLGGMKDADLAVAIARHAWERGVRYFDTAPSYANGASERRLGRALKDAEREELFVNTKTLERDGDAAVAELEESLERLDMEYVDCVQVHECRSIEDAERLTTKGGVVAALQQAKKDKKIRHIGITGHRDPAPLLRALELFEFETALVPVNPLDCHHRSFTTGFLPAAAKRDLGVIAMKIYAGGKLVEQDPPVAVADLVRFALSRPGVAVAVPGADTIARVDVALDAARLHAPKDGEDEAWIDAAGPHRGKDSEWYKDA